MRWLKWLPMVAVVLVVLAVSSLWGHRVIAESMAHSTYLSANAELAGDIRAARTAGLQPSELHVYTAQLALQHTTKPPSDGTFWSQATGDYYSRQSVRLHRLVKRLHAQLRQLTAAARNQVRSDLRTFSHTVALGHYDGMSLRHARTQLADFTLDLGKSQTVGQYRSLAQLVQPAAAALTPTVQARHAEIRGIKSQVAGSTHRLATVRQLMHRKIAWMQGQLQTLTMFDGHQTLGRWLGRVSHWALSRGQLHYAIIGMANLDQVSRAVSTAMRTDMPAKWILVSTEGEWIRWYQGTKLIGSSLCTTGNPALPTVTGHFTIFAKFSPFIFKSEDPIGSQYYYPPSPVSFAMEFQNAGYFIHDAPWRSAFGPGTNGAGQPGTNYGGTHGCVNVPYDVAAFLFGWAPIGTPVIVE